MESKLDDSNSQPLVAFLDTNVVAAYLSGQGAAAHLFDDKVRSKTKYAINPIVVQELFLAADDKLRPAFVNMLEKRMLEILEIDSDKTKDVLDKARGLRDHIVHSNDLFILSSAKSCDYLISDNKEMAHLLKGDGPEVLTAEQFISRVMMKP